MFIFWEGVMLKVFIMVFLEIGGCQLWRWFFFFIFCRCLCIILQFFRQCFIFFGFLEVILALQSCIRLLILLLVLNNRWWMVELVMFFFVRLIGCRCRWISFCMYFILWLSGRCSFLKMWGIMFVFSVLCLWKVQLCCGWKCLVGGLVILWRIVDYCSQSLLVLIQRLFRILRVW